MRLRHRARSVRAVWAPSLLRRVVRHRVTQVVVIVLLGVAAAIAYSSRVAALEAERRQWADTITVLVVTEHVEVGDPVASALTARELPAVAVPPNAAVTVSAGAVARARLYPGEIAVVDRITTTAGSTRDDGSAALTLPVARQVPLIEIGALVDLWTVDGANLSSRRIAHGVAVLAFSDDDITVAVPIAQVADATAASLRPVTVTLVG